MNLTSKRMLQFIAGCAGACALTASAVDPVTYVSDSFEPSAGNGTTNGYAGMLISQYKAQPIGDFLLTTNYVWVSAAGDASALVLTNSTYEATTRPLTNAMGSLVLNLATEGQTLTRVLDGNATNDFFTGGPYYVDTLIQFTPSEDYPTNSIDSGVKAAVFVNVSSNLVVYHGDEAHKTLSTDLGIHIDPAQWYRLTIQLGKLSGAEYAGFKVYLNGIAITNDAAATDDLEYPGTWFLNASSDTTLSAVSFQGTGMIDDLVVADAYNPFSAIPAGVLLTLSFDPAKLFVSVNGSSVASNDTVVSGSTLVMNTVDWYQINSITGDGISYGDVVGTVGAARCTNSETTVTADQAGRTATIATGMYTEWPTGSGIYTNYPMSKVATWASTHGVSVASATANMASYLDDYLFNAAPDTNPKLVISSITVGDGTYKVSVSNTASVAFGSINGTLNYLVTDDLGTAFSGKTSVPVTGITGSSVTNITITGGSEAFIKFTVE